MSLFGNNIVELFCGCSNSSTTDGISTSSSRHERSRPVNYPVSPPPPSSNRKVGSARSSGGSRASSYDDEFADLPNLVKRATERGSHGVAATAVSSRITDLGTPSKQAARQPRVRSTKTQQRRLVRSPRLSPPSSPKSPASPASPRAPPTANSLITDDDYRDS